MTDRIIQISDLHLSEEQFFKGIPVHENVSKILSAAANLKPDLLVLSGDLAAENGGLQIYKNLKDKLKDFPAPYVIMPGNHDKRDELRSIFSWPVPLVGKEEIYFQLQLKNTSLIFLDTTEYAVSNEQMQWLSTVLKTQCKPLIFMHHPPVPLGCPYLDKYSIENSEEIYPFFSKHPQIKQVFCGHYHTDITVDFGQFQVYVCPSSLLQADPRTSDFAVPSKQPGLRLIDVSENRMTTQVMYF